MLTIKEGTDLIKETDEYDLLLVGTNVYGRLTNGWQSAIKYKFPIIHKVNIETKYGDVNKLGKCIDVPINDKLTICLLYITKGYNFRPDIQQDYLEYEALEECLRRINILYKGKRIACPILGSSKFDGNGDKAKIIEIFTKFLTDVDVTLYDYEQISDADYDLQLVKDIMEAKRLFKETKQGNNYYELISQRKAYKN